MDGKGEVIDSCWSRMTCCSVLNAGAEDAAVPRKVAVILQA